MELPATITNTRRVNREATLQLTTAQALVRYLAAQWSERDGVRRRVIAGVYGIFGHGNAVSLGEALSAAGPTMPFYQCRNEQAMVHSAIGFAKASSRCATLACAASIGPGSTNMITGAATATANRLPVLLLPADTFAGRRQGVVLQQLEHGSEADISVNDCFRAVSRFFDRISRPEQLLAALPEAIRVLLDPGATGAVTLSIHQDVEGEAYDFPVRFFEERTWSVVRRPPAPDEVERALDVLRSSDRPLIIAGGGVQYADAGGELVEFSNRFGIPVTETFAGKGAAVGAELLLGGVGQAGTRAANAAAREADVVLCLGTRLSDFTTGSHSLFEDENVRFVSVNVGAADSAKLGAVPVVADARLALGALAEGLNEAGWSTAESYRERIRGHQRRWNDDLEHDLRRRAGERVSQAQLLRALNEQAGEGDTIVVAAGTPPADVLKIWDNSGGSRCHIEFGFSCMTHEIPSGIGIRMAQPNDGEVYVFIGDGTYLMGNTELVTAVQEGFKITVVLVENGGFQSIHALQRDKLGRGFGTELRLRSGGRLEGDYMPIDYAANARSLGCATFEIDTLDEFAAAVRNARAEVVPVVIVAHVEPHRLMLGSNCWWDVGIAQVSADSEVQARSDTHLRLARDLQRFYY